MRNLIYAAFALALLVSGADGMGVADEVPGRGPWVPYWTIMYGGYRQVEDLVAVGADEAWGVDATQVSLPGGGRQEQTAIVHFAGGVWRTAQVADGVGLGALDVKGDDLGFAVGSRGAIYRLRDGAWRPMVSPTTNRLHDVTIGDAGNGWAVGDLETLLRWDGQTWAAVESPIRGVGIRAVAAAGPGRAWAVARSGEILSWQESRWTEWPDVKAFEPNDMAFSASGRGLIAGRDIREWNGSQWQPVTSPYGRCGSVAWVGDLAYLTCDNKMVAYDGGSWREVDLTASAVPLEEKVFQRVVPAPGGAWGLAADGTTVLVVAEIASYVRPETSELLTLDMVDADVGWSGGQSVTAGFVGSAAGSWSRFEALPMGTVVGALAMVSAEDGWAVGRDPGDNLIARMWHWDGSGWNDWPIDKTWEISDIVMLDRDEGWAGRGNVLVRWDGTAWRAVSDAPKPAAVGGISVIRGGDDPEGWFGGYGGLHHLVSGTWVWEPLSDYPGNLLAVNDVEVPDPGEGWAITDTALYKRAGGAWTKVPLPTRAGSTFVDVAASEVGNAWVLVEPDGLFHWSGFAWEYHTLAPMGDAFKPLRIEALRLDPESPATDVWLVGRSPSIGVYRVVTPVDTVHLPLVLNGAPLRP